MKKLILILFLLAAAAACVEAAEKNVIPLEETRNVSTVTVRVGDVVIPRILLDTGFAFDGLMIYKPSYRDSLDLTKAIEVKIPGAGSGAPSTALMIDSASFYLGNIQLVNQRIIVLQSDTYKGFPSNGIIGYSIFGHYATELNYDDGTIVLHESGKAKVDESWTAIPLYFKDNNIPWMEVSVVIEDEEPISLSTYIDYAARDAIELLERPGMKFSLPKDTVSAHLGRGLSGDIYGKTGTISKLIIRPYALKAVKATIAPARVRSKQKDADAILGVGSLRRFNLIFDYANKVLYLKPNKRFGDPFE